MSGSARIERVDRPLPTLVTLSLHHEGRREVLLLSSDPRAFGAALVDARPKGRPIDAIGKKLRTELEGLQIEGLEVDRDRAVLVARAASERRTLVLGRHRRLPYLVLFDGQGERLVVQGALPDELAPPSIEPGFAADAWRTIGPSFAAAIATESLEARRRAAREALKKAIDRQRRKVAAIEADAARAERADALRADASAILAALHTIAPGQQELEVPDYASGAEAWRTIALDPSKPARSVAESLFHAARRLERGQTIAAQRWEAAARDLERLEAIQDAIGDATEAASLEAAIARAEALGLSIARPEEVARRRSRAEPRLPFKRYVSLRGWTIWVGRSAADNDELTLRWARPHHLFLHARGIPGSHVIVPIPKGSQADPDTVLDAATLAAHFSDARGQRVVEVQTAERRHVRKRRGSPAGSVLVDREKVIALRIEPERLARLLATEGHRGRLDGSVAPN